MFPFVVESEGRIIFPFPVSIILIKVYDEFLGNIFSCRKPLLGRFLGNQMHVDLKKPTLYMLFSFSVN